MPGAFLPVLGLIGSALVSTLLAPKPPKPPSPAPTPPAPQAAPLPTSPAAPTDQGQISAADTEAQAKAAADRRKRLAAQATDQPVLGNQVTGNVQVKTLLGE